MLVIEFNDGRIPGLPPRASRSGSSPTCEFLAITKITIYEATAFTTLGDTHARVLALHLGKRQHRQGFPVPIRPRQPPPGHSAL
ncbi:FAD-linked oxidoreductase ZEB1 [Fusarium oxysporum f. sp. albedinis]|nr:FAD-linked oxidoreductase ZEB1 [Fusarium oxysporum f. sp. albedinis]